MTKIDDILSHSSNIFSPSCFFTAANAAAPDREPVFVCCCQRLLLLGVRDLLLEAVLVHVGHCDLDGLELWFVLLKHRNMADRLTQLQDAVNQVIGSYIIQKGKHSIRCQFLPVKWCPSHSRGMNLKIPKEHCGNNTKSLFLSVTPS